MDDGQNSNDGAGKAMSDSKRADIRTRLAQQQQSARESDPNLPDLAAPPSSAQVELSISDSPAPAATAAALPEPPTAHTASRGQTIDRTKPMVLPAINIGDSKDAAGLTNKPLPHPQSHLKGNMGQQQHLSPIASARGSVARNRIELGKSIILGISLSLATVYGVTVFLKNFILKPLRQFLLMYREHTRRRLNAVFLFAQRVTTMCKPYTSTRPPVGDTDQVAMPKNQSELESDPNVVDSLKNWIKVSSMRTRALETSVDALRSRHIANYTFDGKDRISVITDKLRDFSIMMSHEMILTRGASAVARYHQQQKLDEGGVENAQTDMHVMVDPEKIRSEIRSLKGMLISRHSLFGW